MIKLVVFDMDGTLLDTLQDLTTACNEALARQQLPLQTLENVRSFIGNGIHALLKRCLPQELQSDPVIYQKLVEDFQDYYYQHENDKTVPFRGVTELLQELQERQIHVAVLTNKIDALAKKMAAHYFPNLVQLTLGEREGIPLKPDPAGLNEIMDHFQVSAEEVAYVGDSAVDMQTGNAVGALTIGVLWGFQSQEQLEEGGGKHFVATPDEIIQKIGL